MVLSLLYNCVFFFKQKTAYEMRISDWSSDVCSSDLSDRIGRVREIAHPRMNEPKIAVDRKFGRDPRLELDIGTIELGSTAVERERRAIGEACELDVREFIIEEGAVQTEGTIEQIGLHPNFICVQDFRLGRDVSRSEERRGGE